MIFGQADEPSAAISLDDGFEQTTDNRGRFEFRVVYHPATCIVTLKTDGVIGVSARGMLLANSAGSGWVRHEPDEGWLARAGERGADQPGRDTDKVEGGCSEHVLEVDLR